MRRRIQVAGTVQGVGFRPWVYTLARRFDLSGHVLNSTLGVTIEIEGPVGSIEGFLAEFRAHPPALASIDHLAVTTLDPSGDVGFTIRPSLAADGEFVLVPPDIATCPDCLADLRDPANRRYRYPFTNCTNCGPRYSLIRDIPYDRTRTTMDRFTMCPACSAEYHDPADRRFHAQPNACPACGPWVELHDHNGPVAMRDAALAETRRLLAAGAIVAIKGLGGFHLACDPRNQDAVRTLRERKRRTAKPFALMARDLAAVAALCPITGADEAALLSPRRPIVILPARHPEPKLPTLGIMLPYTPLHHLLFDDAPFDTLVMTSANISEEPLAYRNEEVAARLHPLADYFLVHNRPVHTPIDDSVVRTFAGTTRPIRRARGYAPHPIDLGRAVRPVLGTGGELKNTLCLTHDHYGILSPHIGDLENLETLALWEQTLDHLRRFFRITPEAVAYDLHPNYLTTRLAREMKDLVRIPVQHHHAHIAACMAENRVTGPAIGVALDGTGYGTDGCIWGGEILIAEYARFHRADHFRYVALPGGDAAIRHPWRTALAYARDAGITDLDGLPAEHAVIESMLERGINTVPCSSAGRLFDAASAMLGVCHHATYEGQAAIELEAIADPDETTRYPYDGLDFRDTLRHLHRDRATPAQAAARFHNTLANALAAVCHRLYRETGITQVALSGGTFQNHFLLNRLLPQLSPLQVLLHADVPANDAGISLGQALIANEQL